MDAAEESGATEVGGANDANGAQEEEASPTNSGVLFGFWGLNGFQTYDDLLLLQTNFGIGVFHSASSSPNYTVNTLLPLVRSAGMKVALRLTGDHDNYTSSSGDFDIAAWKAMLSPWQDSGVQEFIDDETLVMHTLLDDIFNFAGNDPTASELDEMARYSKLILPGLMTSVRNKATTMPVPETGQYVDLDTCVNQYTNYQGYSDGPVQDYAVAQANAAEALGLMVINGLNIADGGDGTSGVDGWTSGKYAMSADEITTYGEALLNPDLFPALQLFLMWEYDGEELWSDGETVGSEYFNRSDLQAAILALSEFAHLSF